MRKILATGLVLSLLLGTGAALAATGDINATANVLQPLSVTNNLRDLDFGDVFPGLAKSIAFGDATSGKWRVDGEAGKEIAVSFILPANLSDGVNNLPIGFANGDAAWFDADVVGSANAFDPAAGTTQFLNAGTGEFFVWLGGTVTPAGAQPAGVYNGIVTLDAVYTGN